MYLDIFVLIIFLSGIYFGLKNGIIIEVISIFGFVINLILAKNYAPTVLRFFQKKDNLFAGNYFITYIFTFIAIYLIINIILSVIRKILAKQSKGFFDRFLGALVGAIKAFLLISILFIVYINITDFVPSIKDFSKNSKTMVIMADIIPNFEKYIPEYFLDKFNEIRNAKIIEKNLNKIL